MGTVTTLGTRFCLPLLAICLLTESAYGQQALGPIETYLAKEDDSFQWSKRQAGEIGGCNYVELTLTSQTWKGTPWKHQLFLLRPKNATESSHALLFITGGSWKDRLAEIPDGEELPRDAQLFVTLASQLKTPVVVVKQVPFQPMFGGRYEDDLIAHTFEQFVKTGDSEWPLLLPMVKAAARSMDAAQEYAAQAWSQEIKTFTVTGASKRGWTTWLTGASDSRATAIAPMVIDVLNMSPQMKHQRQVWGAYSEEIGDYTERGLQDLLEKDVGKTLREIVDPYSHRDRITQPKLIFIGTNDRYWPIDALNLYWDELVGEKHVVYVPNRGHGLEDLPRVLGGIHALHLQAQGISAMPKPEWDFVDSGEKGCTLRMQCAEEPEAVEVWVATSKKRDFRASKFTSRAVKREGEHYIFEIERPQEGYVAVFGEFVFKRDGLPCFLSTNVQVLAADK